MTMGIMIEPEQMRKKIVLSAVTAAVESAAIQTEDLSNACPIATGCMHCMSAAMAAVMMVSRFTHVTCFSGCKELCKSI
jgi:hypothetical protein